MSSSHAPLTAEQQTQHLMAYAAHLELEVDRLRKQCSVLRDEAITVLEHLLSECRGAEEGHGTKTLTSAIEADVERLGTLLHDVTYSLRYHPAHDQVVSIAVRHLAEEVFRWQQRSTGAHDVVFRLDLEAEYIDWFPARLRHILDNLISNALRYRDTDKGETRVSLELRLRPTHYLLRVSDNGQGFSPESRTSLTQLFCRAAPLRGQLGVGLAVVKLLVEESGGTLTFDSNEGEGSSFIVELPRYDLADYIT